jgi:hypothetical protein
MMISSKLNKKMNRMRPVIFMLHFDYQNRNAGHSDSGEKSLI